jgi:hypothetical protein
MSTGLLILGIIITSGFILILLRHDIAGEEPLKFPQYCVEDEEGNYISMSAEQYTQYKEEQATKRSEGYE